MVSAIVVQDLTFQYRPGLGLDGVTFGVLPGELVGVVGPNTAGKSTLLRLLSKVLVPQRGRIQIAGRDVATTGRLALARQVAVVPQEFQVAFPFRVAEVVLMGRYPHTAGAAWGSRDHQIAWAAMETMGIGGLAGRSIDELSGGERQLVSIARALTQEPSILLLDEPTAHLDLRHQRTVLTTVLARRPEGRRTTVLVSHDLNLAAEHCDRLLLLVEGRVQAFGRPEEVMTSETLERAYGCAVEVERDPASGRPRLRSPLSQPGPLESNVLTPRM
jgi:iron complex transport system ATP-binding protein